MDERLIARTERQGGHLGILVTIEGGNEYIGGWDRPQIEDDGIQVKSVWHGINHGIIKEAGGGVDLDGNRMIRDRVPV